MSGRDIKCRPLKNSGCLRAMAIIGELLYMSSGNIKWQPSNDSGCLRATAIILPPVNDFT